MSPATRPKLRRLMKPLLGFVFATAALLALAAAGTLLWSERWRWEPDLPAKADAMIVLAGAPARPRHAAELYRQGLAPIVYLARPAERSQPMEEEVNRGILLQGGVPEGAIRTFAEGAKNTLAEAQVSLARLPDEVKTVLVVTSPKHVRRARMIFGDVLSQRGIRVAVLATPDEANPEPWWSSEPSARQSGRELAKALLYSAGIRYSD